MTRSFHQIPCGDETLSATIDVGTRSTGILMVSGGNEIKSGAHGGMSKLAQKLAEQGISVMRYDRRGVGESSGENNEFLSSKDDIIAASAYFRKLLPEIDKIIAFGNCDAATALALYASETRLDGLILANPWIIESQDSGDAEPTAPTSSAIRSRYWERLKNPRTLVDLLKGNIDLKKLLSGLKKASRKDKVSSLAISVREALTASEIPIKILAAKRDTTALAFLAAWKNSDFQTVRQKDNIQIDILDSASHSFADDKAKLWLEHKLIAALTAT